MGWASTVPAALAGLVAAFRAAPGLDGVLILDGPEVTAAPVPEAITVGFTGQRMSHTGAYPEAASVDAEGDTALAGMALSGQEETYTVHNMVAVRDGSTDIAAARIRAYELLAACGAALTADKTLGGAVAMARITTSSLTQDQTQRGALATIMFDVAVNAYTRR
jgi:hypothetical protein